METLKKFGGTAGIIVLVSGWGITRFVPDHRAWGWLLFAVGAILLVAAIGMNRSDLTNALKGRPFRHGANAVFYTLLVLGIVGSVDFLAARHNRRFDMTGQGIHTLSDQTIQILKGLEKDGVDVTALAFYSNGEPGRQRALDLLDEYKYHTTRLTVKPIDPLRSPGEVRTYGVEQDGTVILSTGTGEARIPPSFTGTGLTEEELTNALIKATAKTKKAICVTTGHGEKRIEDTGPDGLQQAAEALKKENFDVREIRLLESAGIPADCSTVLVPGPKHPLVGPESEALARYLDSGGRGLVLAEPGSATGIEPLLEAHGIKLGNDFVVDVNPMARMMGGSPATPVVYEYGDHPITKGFEGLMTIFPTVESVSTTTAPDVTTQTIAHTGAQSWGETGPLADRVSFDAASDRQGPLDIAVSSVRKLKTEPAADGNTPAAPAPETRLVVFGDSDYAGNSALTLGGNKDLFLNTIAWLNERTDLISIRPRTQLPQPVVLTGLQASLLRWYSLVLSPLLAIVVGVGVYLRRRRL